MGVDFSQVLRKSQGLIHRRRNSYEELTRCQVLLKDLGT